MFILVIDVVLDYLPVAKLLIGKIGHKPMALPFTACRLLARRHLMTEGNHFGTAITNQFGIPALMVPFANGEFPEPNSVLIDTICLAIALPARLRFTVQQVELLHLQYEAAIALDQELGYVLAFRVEDDEMIDTCSV